MLDILLIFLVSANTIASQLILKNGLERIGAPAGDAAGIQAFLLAGVLSPWVIGAVALQGLGYVLWWFVIVRVKLGVAFAISGSMFYAIMALAGWVTFGEVLTPLQWLGLGLVTFGVLCLTWGGI